MLFFLVILLLQVSCVLNDFNVNERHFIKNIACLIVAFGTCLRILLNLGILDLTLTQVFAVAILVLCFKDCNLELVVLNNCLALRLTNSLWQLHLCQVNLLLELL